MAYPGEGYKMSSYGYKPYNPEQIKEQWRETTAREVKISQQHATTKPNTKVIHVYTCSSPPVTECHMSCAWPIRVHVVISVLL